MVKRESGESFLQECTLSLIKALILIASIHNQNTVFGHFFGLLDLCFYKHGKNNFQIRKDFSVGISEYWYTVNTLDLKHISYDISFLDNTLERFVLCRIYQSICKIF